MSDPPDNIVLVYLRSIDAKVDRLAEDMREVEPRLTAVELAVASLRRDVAAVSETQAHRSARIDRLENRLERIERRLDIFAER